MTILAGSPGPNGVRMAGKAANHPARRNHDHPSRPRRRRGPRPGLSLAAFAQSDYPARTITMIVPFPPGGVADITARPVADAMGRHLKQTVIVENKAAAGGGVGMHYVARAKPDGYTFCKACEIDRDYCRAQPACEKQTKLFMLHRAAFEQRDPRMLMGIYADFHSALMVTIQQILQTIIADGVTIRSPKTYVDKDGRCLVVEYYDEQGQRCVVNDLEAHPLFRPLGELISRTGISLAELGMSGKNAEQEVVLPGQLQSGGKGVEAIEDFARKQSAALEALGGLVMRAKEKTREDPVLIEFKEQIGGAGS